MTNDSNQRLANWDARSKPYIISAAVAPIVATLILGRTLSPVTITIDIIAWLVFLVDLIVRRSLVPGYLGTGSGRFDTAIVILTFPWFLVPGFGGTQFMSVFRLARLVRLFTATGLGTAAVRLLKRLGTLGVGLIGVSLISAQIVLRAEPASSGFENYGDALWWAMVSFTTVGYGDLYPVTPEGRLAGVLMMFAGLAALGTIAAILADVLTSEDLEASNQGIIDEIRSLRDQVAEMKQRLDG